MSEIAQLQSFLTVGAILFVLGLLGFLVRRNLIVMFLCAEMMLQGVSLSLVAFGLYHDDWGGQMLVMFLITVAACEAGIALALIVVLFDKSGKLDMAAWQDMREENIPPFIDRRVPEERAEDRVWPTLVPAGIEPPANPEEQLHRPRV